jgi:hypothetical protein
MDFHGALTRVLMLLEMGISPSSDGRERMAVHGTVLRVLMRFKGASLHPPMGERE